VERAGAKMGVERGIARAMGEATGRGPSRQGIHRARLAGTDPGLEDFTRRHAVGE
jgi:hypothetical protein